MMTTSTVRRAANVVVRALLIAAIALMVFVAYGLANNAWYHVLAVQGGSMQPTITAGDMIVITRPPAQVEVGQVLTLQVDGAIVTHRVVEVRSDGTFTTQGDANDTRDDFSANDVRIVGEYRFSLPLIGMLIEPFISGAWFSANAPIAVAAESGSWDSPADLRIYVWNGEGIVWNPPSDSTSPSATPVPTPTAAATESTSDPPGSPESTASHDPAASAGETMVPTAEATPSAAPSSSEDPAPTATSMPSPTDTPTPTDTPAPSPTDTPSPTPEPTPGSNP
jgi:signal peptidase I